MQKNILKKRKIPKRQPDPDEYEQAKSDVEKLKRMACDGEFDLYFFDESGLSEED